MVPFVVSTHRVSLDKLVKIGYEDLEDELDLAVVVSIKKTHHIRSVHYARVGRKFRQLEYIRGNDLHAVGVLSNGLRMAINSEDDIIQLSALTGRSRLGAGIPFGRSGAARTSGGAIIEYKWITKYISEGVFHQCTS